ncbi:urease accessory UreF family protein [Cryobacterium sp. SO2]|uniref:urease accessory protein UreF n=1 Tax=Cryobacterium sp. SO2 TaxID=1897060 RepID=UPI00223CF9DE|nr:urease accessory UreF family protein [Cryobacterium sp. SO2]WEO78755.1 urease accessory UreF family protein [Cryobacterium sp. SO2]
MTITTTRLPPPLSSATISMMLADARLPVGGHVHSAGLEPALAGGMSAAQVPAYMLGRARTVTLVEAGTAVVARHLALQAAAPQDRGGKSTQQLVLALARVDRAWAARTPSRAVRDVSRSLARGYQRLGGRLWAQHPAVIAAGLMSTLSSPDLSRPVLLGVIAAAAGLNAESLVRLVVYDDAQTIAAALLKLEPLDPAIPPAWVLAACAAAEEFVPDLAALTSADAIPAWGAPESEGWAEAHSRTTQRLFRA